MAMQRPFPKFARGTQCRAPEMQLQQLVAAAAARNSASQSSWVRSSISFVGLRGSSFFVLFSFGSMRACADVATFSQAMHTPPALLALPAASAAGGSSESGRKRARKVAAEPAGNQQPRGGAARPFSPVPVRVNRDIVETAQRRCVQNSVCVCVCVCVCAGVCVCVCVCVCVASTDNLLTEAQHLH
jgi:hypothetical protein